MRSFAAVLFVQQMSASHKKTYQDVWQSRLGAGPIRLYTFLGSTCNTQDTSSSLTPAPPLANRQCTERLELSCQGESIARSYTFQIRNDIPFSSRVMGSHHSTRDCG